MTASSSRARPTLADIKGQNVNLVELSVSHYLLARGLDSVGAHREATSRSSTPPTPTWSRPSQTADVTAVVTWNPLLSEILAMPDADHVFNSSQIPGEIIDIMMVNTETLADNPDFGKALVGAWYEAMALMSATRRRGHRGPHRDGVGLGHRPCRLRRAARHDADVLRPGRRGRLHQRAPSCRRRWTIVAQLPVRPRHPRRRRDRARTSSASSSPTARSSATPTT